MSKTGFQWAYADMADTSGEPLYMVTIWNGRAPFCESVRECDLDCHLLALEAQGLRDRNGERYDHKSDIWVPLRTDDEEPHDSVSVFRQVDRQFRP